MVKLQVLSSLLSHHPSPNLTTFPGWSQCPDSPSRFGQATEERVLALSNTPQRSLGRRPRNARAQLASPSSSKILKVLVARLALQPPPSDPKQMEIRVQHVLGPRCSRPGSPIEQPQPPQASALLSGQAQAASDRNGWTESLWESHVCQPSACQLSG